MIPAQAYFLAPVKWAVLGLYLFNVEAWINIFNKNSCAVFISPAGLRTFSILQNIVTWKRCYPVLVSCNLTPRIVFFIKWLKMKNQAHDIKKKGPIYKNEHQITSYLMEVDLKEDGK